MINGDSSRQNGVMTDDSRGENDFRGENDMVSGDFR